MGYKWNSLFTRVDLNRTRRVLCLLYLRIKKKSINCLSRHKCSRYFLRIIKEMKIPLCLLSFLETSTQIWLFNYVPLSLYNRNSWCLYFATVEWPDMSTERWALRIPERCLPCLRHLHDGWISEVSSLQMWT